MHVHLRANSMKKLFTCILLCVLQSLVFAQRDKRRKHTTHDQSIISSALEHHAGAQRGNFHANLEAQGIITSKGTVPFWMRANQYGSIPLSGPSLGLLGGVNKTYDQSKKRLVDYGFSFQGRVNVGNTSEFILVEGYAKARLSIFELKAGRSKEFMGLVDSTLSSGAFAVSGNALGIPKVQLAIPEFWTLPYSGKLFAIKGTFSHGWLGDNDINFPGHKSIVTYFHQKSFYGRFGKPNWRLKLLGGFNHQVFWGSEKEIYGKRWTLSEFQTFENVVLGKTTKLNKVEKSKVGNALGSIDLGIQYDFTNTRINLYRLFFYDVGALFHLANVRDGLYGLSIANKRPNTKSNFRWNKFVFEFFFTKDQAGYPWSKATPSGDDDYYNNYFYAQGWSYNGIALGNPFITTRVDARAGLPNQSFSDYFINNRVMAFHFGTDLTVKKIHVVAKLSYSKNYGTFGTSPYGHSLGKKFSVPRGYFGELDQFSAYVEGTKQLRHGFYVGCVGAFDVGGLLYNSVGFIAKAGKTF